MAVNTPFGTGPFGTGPFGSTPFYTNAGIIDAILQTTGHSRPAQELTKRTAIATFINNRYQEIVMGRFWRWLQKRYDFTFFAQYQTGTFSIDNGSYTVQGYGVQWDSTMVGQSFQEVGIDAIYKIKDVPQQNQLTLETPWAEPSVPAILDSNLVASGSDYVIAINTYKVPEDCDTLKTIVVDSSIMLRMMGVQDFRVLQQNDPLRLGRPQVATLVKSNNDEGSTFIEVYPSPDRMYNVELDYNIKILRLGDDTNYAAIPDQYRAVLYWGGLADFFTITLRDPTSGDRTEARFQKFLRDMQGDRQLTEQDLVMVPARNRLAMSRLSRFPISISAEDFGRLD